MSASGLTNVWIEEVENRFSFAVGDRLYECFHMLFISRRLREIDAKVSELRRHRHWLSRAPVVSRHSSFSISLGITVWPARVASLFANGDFVVAFTEPGARTPELVIHLSLASSGDAFVSSG
jgi:hypothetical protein